MNKKHEKIYPSTTDTAHVGHRQYKHKAKKSLGQNFLKSILALNKIVESGEINENDIILEIGPGKGALTEKLLEKGCKVIAVEKDKDLTVLLQDKFSKKIKEGKLIIIEEDILTFKIDAYVGHRQYKIIANIPYNITGAILKKFLTEENQPERMVLMVQNEVAQRIVARDGKESILSVSVKAYGDPKIIMKVAKRYFSPSPKVDSAVILIKNINKDLFQDHKGETFVGVDEGLFWEVIHAGFAHKRKMLISNLKDFCVRQGLTRTQEKINWSEIFKKNNLNLKMRAEELKISDWINILKDINTQK